MTWAAHDPEGWNEVCVRGIKEKVIKEGNKLLYNEEENGIRHALETLASNLKHPYVYEAWVLLSLWAQEEVAEHEADYLMSRHYKEEGYEQESG